MVNMPFYHPDMDLILKWVNTVLRTILTLFWPGSIYFDHISAGNPVTFRSSAQCNKNYIFQKITGSTVLAYADLS